MFTPQLAKRAVRDVLLLARLCGIRTAARFVLSFVSHLSAGQTGTVAWHHALDDIATKPRRVLCGDIRANLVHIFPDGIREVWIKNACLGPLSLEPGDLVVDAGAHYGLFTVLAAGRGARVVAIEPMRENVDRIARNVKANGFENVSILCTAVGSSTRLSLSTNGSMYTQLRSAKDEAIEVQAITIPELFSLIGNEQIDLFKIDIEGGEFSLLRDSTAWLPKIRQYSVEVHLWAGNLSEIEDLFRSEGFQTRVVGDRPYIKHLYAWRGACTQFMNSGTCSSTCR